MKYGVIIRNVTDLRAEAKFQSERKSQLLFDEPILIEKNQDGYFFIHQVDGYSGWADERAVNILSRENFELICNRLNYQVMAATCPITPAEKGKRIPPFLFYGSKLHLVEKSGNKGIIITGRNQRVQVAMRNLAPVPDPEKVIIRPTAIIKEARKFLGTPYLWGGVTPFGFDCSGLVQMVYKTLGLTLPRDSKDQRNCGTKVDIGQAKTGDLLLFKGHVAIAIDRYKLIHSSLGAGGVAINSLNPRDPDYRKDLIEIFIEARRVLK